MVSIAVCVPLPELETFPSEPSCHYSDGAGSDDGRSTASSQVLASEPEEVEDMAPRSPSPTFTLEDGFAARMAVVSEEAVERMALFQRIECLQRAEVARFERTQRDAISKARAVLMRSVLITAPHRGCGPSVWPRHPYLPPAALYARSPYTGSVPGRSCLRRTPRCDSSAPLAIDGMDVSAKPPASSSPLAVDGEAPLSESPSALDSRRARRVAVTDEVAVHAGEVLDETDGELASAQWRCISLYAPVRHMVMTSLKARYGADASDPHAWMATVEQFAWLDDLFCAVKDAYQLLHNEEAAAWSEILMAERQHRERDWWSRIGLLWP